MFEQKQYKYKQNACTIKQGHSPLFPTYIYLMNFFFSYNHKQVDGDMLGFDLEGANSINRFKKDFEELNLIGSGGFSSVYKVRNRHDKRQYALKIVKIKPSEYKKDVFDYLQKVLGEVKLLSTLRHPNVVKYHGCWMDAQQFPNQQSIVEYSQGISDSSEEIQMFIQQSQSSCGIGFQHESNSIELKKQTEPFILKNSSQAQNFMSNKLLKFREIRIFILSELGQNSLQKYVSERNKKLSRNYDSLSNKYIDNMQLKQKTNSSKSDCKANQVEQEQKWQNEKKMRIENYRFILEIILGLMHIHNQKIIHRDIKLQNIILDKNMHCKIIDFGLAKRVRAMKSLQLDRWVSQQCRSQIEEQNYEYEYDYESEQTSQPQKQKHSMRIGTKIFSSPQQTSSDVYDHRTDIFSLAMAIALMFSYPSTVHEQRELLHEIRNKNLQKLNVDSRLKSLLQKCLSEQKDRPQLIQLKICVKKLMLEQLQDNENNIIKKNPPQLAYKNGKRVPLSETVRTKCKSSKKNAKLEREDSNKEIMVNN